MLIFNIVLTCLILQMLLNIFSINKQKETLSCGIFGWTGSESSLFDIDKFKILGILNQSRGKDSCGVYMNEELYKGDNIGTNNEALFTDMMIHQKLKIEKESKIVIGHTRNSSRAGIKSVDNTHPFMFEIENNHNFIGAHNGTLDNHVFLAEKYDIKLTDNNGRVKVDSEILLEIISKTTSDNPHYIKVLQEYKGAAALVMHSTKDPDIMYVYRGRSKKFDYSTSQIQDERPLHYWNNSKSSMYFSSDYEPLELIANKKHNEKDSNIFTFKSNVLYTIKKGVIISMNEIDRSKNKKYISMHEFKSQSRNNNKKKNIFVRKTDTYVNKQPNRSKNIMYKSESEKMRENVISNMSNEEANICKSIFYEKVIRNEKNVKNNRIYFENFRYKQNGKFPADGAYIHSDNNGFVFLSKSITEAKEKLKKLSIKDSETSSLVTIHNADLDLFYIVDGILLNKELDYKIITERGVDKYTVIDLSHMSMYPITSYYEPSYLKNKKDTLLYKEHNLTKNQILRNGKYVKSESIQPISSTYIYIIKDGIISNSFYNQVWNSTKQYKVLKNGKVNVTNAYKPILPVVIKNPNSGTFEINVNSLISEKIKDENIDDEEIEFLENDNKKDKLKYSLSDFKETIESALELGVEISNDNYDDNEVAMTLFHFCQNLEDIYNPMKKWLDNYLSLDNNLEIDEYDEYYDDEEVMFIEQKRFNTTGN